MVDEKTGLSLNLNDYRVDARDCVGCSSCRWIDFIYMSEHDHAWRCPPWQKYKLDAYGACGKMKIIHGLLSGDSIGDGETLRHIAYACSLCGACDVGCKRNLDLEPLLALEALRVWLVAQGLGPLPQQKTVSNNILNSGNRFGLSQSQRRDWINGRVNVTPRGKTLYFVGCRGSFARKEIPQAVASILTGTGIEFSLLEEEMCCGSYLIATGQISQAQEIARRNIDVIRISGASTVIFGCAECYRAFKVSYPKLLGISTADLPFNVTHIVEIARKWFEGGILKFTNAIPAKAAYHDPCALGRLSEPWHHWEGKRRSWGVLDPPREIRRGTHGVYDEPRALLKAIPGMELVEMVRNHENAWCCGSGAGVEEAFPELALWTTGERLREAVKAGVQAIVSACPGCEGIFSTYIRSNTLNIKVLDIAEILATACGCQKHLGVS